MGFLRYTEWLVLSLASLSWTALLVPSSQCHAASLTPREFRNMAWLEAKPLVDISNPLKQLEPSDPNSHLSKILIPRPRKSEKFCQLLLISVPLADTENNTLVRNYIVTTLKALDWHVELDKFTASTPNGPKAMANIIATKDPSASRRLVLSAHYDSKFFPDYPENQVCLPPITIYDKSNLIV